MKILKVPDEAGTWLEWTHGQAAFTRKVFLSKKGRTCWAWGTLIRSKVKTFWIGPIPSRAADVLLNQGPLKAIDGRLARIEDTLQSILCAERAKPTGGTS